MPKTDKKLIDIAAEIRAARNTASDMTLVSSDWLVDWADRIERAANNLESSFGMALSIEDGLRKRDAERAPSNAAAMREAMERIVNCVLSIIGSQHVEIIKFGLEEIKRISRAALSAPARNADRFATLDEAREAFQEMRGHRISADVELWDSMDEAGAFVRWLFDEPNDEQHGGAPAPDGAECGANGDTK